jgi:hypothetical protein
MAKPKLDINKVVVPLPGDRRDVKHTMDFWQKFYDEAGVKLTRKKARQIQENMLRLGLKLKENEDIERDNNQ